MQEVEGVVMSKKMALIDRGEDSMPKLPYEGLDYSKGWNT